jgi:hypothetical protein
VEYRICVDSEQELWIAAGDVTGGEMLELWRAGGPITCCTLVGGFAIRAGGKAWNEESLDEIRMSASWLGAIIEVLRGGATAQVWAWEESCMRMVRRGDALEMFDVHHSGHVVCPRIVVPLRELAAALAAAARAAGAVFDEVLRLAADLPADVRGVLTDNLACGWLDHAREIEAALARPLPAASAGEVPPALHLAIVLDERRAPIARDELELIYDGARPLQLAVSLRRYWAVDKLLAAGAQVDAADDRGDTALLGAVRRREPPLVRALLAAGADATGGGTQAPLRECMLGAMYHDTSEVRRLLLKAGAVLDLFGAIAGGEIAKTIARAGEARVTPEALVLWVQRLHTETLRGAGEISARVAAWRPAIAALLAAGASWSDGRTTALHEAVITGRVELVRALLELGATPDREDASGETPLVLAERHGMLAIADLLGGAVASIR